MLSSQDYMKTAKGDIPIMHIPGICVGRLTASTGEASLIHATQNDRGTSHTVIPKGGRQKKFLEM